jgi:hypothetical protein
VNAAALESESVNQEWLKTPEGRAWLETDEGTEWWRSIEGQWWSRSADAHRWYDELAQSGWVRYWAGTMPGPPEWAMTPDDAPQIGARVRLRNPETTLGGTSFEDGEVALVTEIKFSPVGAVHVTLRTPDGRQVIVMRRDDFTV